MSNSACIWYISKYLVPPGRGTVGTRGYRIMRELASRGDQIVLITSNSNHLAVPRTLRTRFEMERVDGMQLWWLRTMRYSAAKSLRRALSWIHFEWRLACMPLAQLPKPDVIVVSSLSLLTVLNGLRLRRRFGCRLVFEVRDIWPLTLTAEGGFSAKNPLVWMLGAIERLGYRHADAIIGTMPNLGEHVQEVLREARTVHCVPMGVPDESLEPSATLPKVIEQISLPSEKCIVAHVGSIGISNALETLLRCAQQLSEDTRLHFLLVGAGDLAESYAQRFASLRNLTVVPRVDSAAVPVILERCDIAYFATHPSRVWAFGQSLNKVIDYMLAGKPVVGSYSGFPSMIDEAKCGEFVPAGDPIALAESLQRLASLGPDHRVAMGARGREWLLKHRRYKDLATAYRRILIGP